MKKIISKITNYTSDNSLIRDGLVLFSATMFLNVCSYLFHFYMGRVLGPADYGILGALLSIVYFISVPFNTIQTTVTKTVSELIAEKNYEKIKYYSKRLLKILFFISLAIMALFLISSSFISRFLNIPINPLFVLSFFILFALVLPITRGVLQGISKFKDLSISLILEGIIKIVFGVIFVYFGLGVRGAVAAIVLSYAVSFILTVYYIRFLNGYKPKKFSSGSFKYSIPVLFALLSLTAFFTVDVFFVKHYFSDVQAGYYAALSILGKTIFFASFSIGSVMFPKVSEFKASKKEYKHLFNKSIFLVFLIGTGMTLFYFLFPSFVVKMLYGSKYLNLTQYLTTFSLFILFYSLCYITCFYNLAIRRYSFIYILAIFNILQILLLYYYHSSISDIIEILLYLMVLLFLILFIYTKNEPINSNTSIQ